MAVDERFLGDGQALRQALQHPVALPADLAGFHAQEGLHQALVEQGALRAVEFDGGEDDDRACAPGVECGEQRAELPAELVARCTGQPPRLTMVSA